MRRDTLSAAVLHELECTLRAVPEEEIFRFSGLITGKQRIFCDAAGRSRLQLEGFAMRLKQMGYDSYVVGETTTPAIRAGDILLQCSASGETPTLVEHARKAQEIGARLLLITTNNESSLAAVAGDMIILNAGSKQKINNVSIQPMGSLFEQSVGILLDIIVLYRMEQDGISSDEMYQNHANLE